MIMLDLVRHLFQEKFVSSELHDTVVASVPLRAVGCTLQLTEFRGLFWLQLSAIVLLESIQNVALAVLVYKFIHRQRGSLLSYLLGYGLVCPLLLYTPFWVVRVLDLRNLSLKIASAAGASLLFFRCLEAMHGTVPPFAAQSLRHFVLYYAATVQFEFNAKTQLAVPATRRELLRKLARFVRLFAEASLLFSLLIPCRYRVFGTRNDNTVGREDSGAPSAVASAALSVLGFGLRLADNLLLAFLTSICLEVGATGMGLVTSLASGLVTIDLNFSPLTASQSPSEFWGKRWNTLVSTALKRGVFEPLRKNAGWSRSAAALGTFVASGLLHEYVIAVMLYQILNFHDEAVFFGKHFAFFTWNAVVLIVEALTQDTAAARWISQRVSGLARTGLVLLTVLPISHLFTDVYVDIGFYDDFSVGFPRIIWIPSLSER